MLRGFFLISLFLFSNSAIAEIEDTANERIFFTSKAPCKLSIPKSLGMNIEQERTSGIAEGKLVSYKLMDQRGRYLRVILNTIDRSCSDSSSCLDNTLNSPIYEGVTLKDIKRYDKGNFSVAEFIGEFEQKGKVRQGRYVAAYSYTENCQADVLLQLHHDARLPPVEPILEILDTLRVE